MPDSMSSAWATCPGTPSSPRKASSPSNGSTRSWTRCKAMESGSSSTSRVFPRGSGGDRKSVGWGKGEDLGGRRIIKKKKKKLKSRGDLEAEAGRWRVEGEGTART